MKSDNLYCTILSYAHFLKNHGFVISLPDIITALQAVTEVGVKNRGDFCAVLRSAFVKHAEDVMLFDQLFYQFWSLETIRKEHEQPNKSAFDQAMANDNGAAAALALFAGDTGTSYSQEQHAWNERPYCLYSPIETLRRQDFAGIPVEKDAQLSRLIRAIIQSLVRNPSYKKANTATGFWIDFRKMLRRNLKYGGETFELPRLKRKLKIKRIYFLCDVSGSMDPYLRFMLTFIKEFQRVHFRVDTYVFATRLHRITDLLKKVPFSSAMDSISKLATDWGGGTRIGECLSHFNAMRETKVSDTSSIVVIYSDGWDRGDPRELDKQMARLRRRCYKLMWINPLLGGSGYEPTCRGMKTALPYIDFFLPGHNIRSLDMLAKTIHSLL